jgi:mannose-6-phosphate isomerase-like protein (cupin superfamily)
MVEDDASKPAVTSIATAPRYTWAECCDGWHLLRRSDLSVIQERMPPKISEVAHSHARARQFFYVLSGTLSILADGEIHALAAGDGLEIAPKLVHRVFNDSDADVHFLVVSAPPSHGDRIVAAEVDS